MDSLIKIIKQKHELSGITDKVIKREIANLQKKYKVPLKNLARKEQKIIVKEIRAALRKYVGQYRASTKNRELLLKKNKLTDLLESHTSTRERLSSYKELKKILKKLKISSILDLGCGLNPLALATPSYIYYAADINEGELALIKKYFKKHKIRGKTFIYDLTNPTKSLPKADCCLLLKVLDVVANNNQQLTRKIINTIPARYIIISFATHKLSGKPMNLPTRPWFENLLEQGGYIYTKIKTENEVFYIIKRSRSDKV